MAILQFWISTIALNSIWKIKGTANIIPKSKYLGPCTNKRLLLGVAFAQCISLSSALFADVKHGQEFHNWTVHCEIPNGEQSERCFIFQNIVRSKEKDRLVHVAIGYLTDDYAPAAIITLPLGVSLKAGIKMELPGVEPLVFQYDRCDQTGCFGAVKLRETDINALSVGGEARIRFLDGRGNVITTPISLLGFEEGFTALGKPPG